MKPKNKEQERFVKWTNELDGPTLKQAAYAKRHCFDEYILESRNGCFCTGCKHVWKDKDASDSDKRKCPHCKKTHKIIHHKKQLTEKAYFTVVTTKQGFQAVHWFLVTRKVSKQMDDYLFVHVGSEWINQSGKSFSVELPRYTMSWVIDAWQNYSPMELRRKSIFIKALDATATYYCNVLPILKRNGWKPNHDFDGYDTELMKNLLSNRAFEAWYKQRHYGVCWDWIKQERFALWRRGKAMVTTDELTVIKLANRRHIKFENTSMWLDYKDYVNDLVYMRQDIHNPKIVFPENFQEAHQLWHDRAERKREKAREVERQEQEARWAKEKAAKDEQKSKWIAKYAQCFTGMCLLDGEFCIKPLISMDEFKAEHDHMHHCIVTYYGKVNTLLLSIEHNGKKCETAEINLLSGDLIQCRGVNNAPSHYHNEIVDMLRNYMEYFVRRSHSERKITTLPVPSDFYKKYKIAI